jgi:hypothetical protein
MLASLPVVGAAGVPEELRQSDVSVGFKGFNSVTKDSCFAARISSAGFLASGQCLVGVRLPGFR